jgi:Xaa-Pro aminopeptidase
MPDRTFYEFGAEEYALRYRRARDSMAQRGIDALLITDAINYRYFTGHVGRTSNRPAFFLLPLSAEPIVLAAAELGTRDVLQTCHVRDVRGYPLPFSPDPLAEILRDKGLAGAVIGIERNDTFFGGFRSQLQFDAFQKLENLLPGARFCDCSELIWMQRMVKTSAEVDCIRKACEITARAYEESFRALKPGMTELDLARHIVATMIWSGADIPALGKHGPCAAVLMDATRPAEELHVPCEKPLGPGDLVHVDLGAIYKGYHSDYARAAVIGKASDFQKRSYAPVKDHVTRAIEMLHAGMHLGEIPCHWHSVGLEYVEGPFGGLLNRGIHGRMSVQPGMVLCLEEMATGPSGETYHFEENVVVQEDRVELLSLAPVELFETEL